VLEGRQPTESTLEFSLEMMKVYEAVLLSHGRPMKIE